MADINLLPLEEKDEERAQSLGKKLSLISIVVLVITAVFTLITLVFFTSIVAKRNQLIADVTDSTTKIEGLKKTEELAVVVKSKASSADKILSTRQDHADMLQKLSALVPLNVYFADIKFSTQKISLSGKAKTSGDIAGLVSSFLSEKGSDLISNVTVDSLGSDQTGVYQFSMTVLLAK